MKTITFILVVLFSSATVFASGVFTLSKSQQNRLNTIIKQLKIPSGEYKLTVTRTGVILSGYEPTIVIATGETITKEKIVTETKTIEVPKEIIKEVIVEKILPDPRVITGSIVFVPSDIEKIRYCGTNYPRETIDYQAKRGQCIVNIFYEKGGIYNSEP